MECIDFCWSVAGGQEIISKSPISSPLLPPPPSPQKALHFTLQKAFHFTLLSANAATPQKALHIPKSFTHPRFDGLESYFPSL